MPPNGSSIYFLIKFLQLRSESNLWGIALGHNQVSTSNGRLRKIKYIYFTYTRGADTGYLSGKPKLAKNHGSRQTRNCPLCNWRYNAKAWRQRPRALYLRQLADTTDIPLCISPSLPLSHALYIHTIAIQDNNHKHHFYPTCIYKYTNFGLITNIASIDP